MSLVPPSAQVAGSSLRQARSAASWRPGRRWHSGLGTLGTIFVLFLLWSLASWLQWVSPVFLPSPLRVVQAFGSVATKGYVDSTLAEHAAASLGRVFAALIASIAVGVPVGLAIGASPLGRGILDPVIEFLRPLPPLAYLPLIIIWFGIGEPAKIIVISLAMIPPIAISTAAGIRSASATQINAALSLGATRRQVLSHVLLPSAAPAMLTGIRIALGTGWSTLVAAELVAASRGLGFMIESAAQFLVTDVVIVGIIVIAALAILFESTLRFVERILLPWSRHR